MSHGWEMVSVMGGNEGPHEFQTMGASRTKRATPKRGIWRFVESCFTDGLDSVPVPAQWITS